MKNKPLFITILFLFGVFLVLYITQATGYYEYKTNRKSTLTEEAIEQFEQDIKSGKKIDISNYKVNEIDNSNRIGKATLGISKTLEKYINKFVKGVFKSISKVMEE